MSFGSSRTTYQPPSNHPTKLRLCLATAMSFGSSRTRSRSPSQQMGDPPRILVPPSPLRQQNGDPLRCKCKCRGNQHPANRRPRCATPPWVPVHCTQQNPSQTFFYSILFYVFFLCLRGVASQKAIPHNAISTLGTSAWTA